MRNAFNLVGVILLCVWLGIIGLSALAGLIVGAVFGALAPLAALLMAAQ